MYVFVSVVTYGETSLKKQSNFVTGINLGITGLTSLITSKSLIDVVKHLGRCCSPNVGVIGSMMLLLPFSIYATYKNAENFLDSNSTFEKLKVCIKKKLETVLNKVLINMKTDSNS